MTDFNLPACSIKIWINQKTYYHLYAWNSAPESEKGNSLWNTQWCTWRKSVHMCKFQNRQKRNIRKVYMYCNISSQWKKKNLVNKTAITAFRRLRWIYVYCLSHEIFENIVFVIWIKNVLQPGYNFSLVVIYICHIELCVIKDLYRTERTHYLYFHM